MYKRLEYKSFDNKKIVRFITDKSTSIVIGVKNIEYPFFKFDFIL